MEPRLAYDKLSPESYKAIYATYAQIGTNSNVQMRMLRCDPA